MDSGFINVIKPTGMTSNDLVAKLRGQIKRAYGEKIKVGHTGTLDPNAAGVMILAIGKATGFCRYVIEKDKKYIAEILLGKQTTTLDTYGTIIAEQIPKEHSEEEIRAVLSSFIGTTVQTPPEFSAIKINGQRLYKLAREGRTIEELPQRSVEISEIRLIEKKDHILKIEVCCSSGTYIRSLARDIGEKLGEAATMTLLIRHEVDGHRIQASHTPEELSELIEQKALERVFVPIDEMVKKYPALHLKSGEKLYVNGASLNLSKHLGKIVEEGLYRVYFQDGFLGIGCVRQEDLLRLKSETLAR